MDLIGGDNMSFFKKIASFFFEETEEDVVLEEELQPIEIKKKETVTVSESAKENVIQPVEVKKTPLREATPVGTRNEQEEKENRKFVNIDITAQKEIIKKPKDVVQAVKRDIIVKKTAQKEKVEYEFTPVISPIFGSTEDETKPKQAKRVHISPSISNRTTKKNPLGTIISPYFGVNELEEFEEKAKKIIEEKEKKEREERKVEETVLVEQKENVKSMSLADMLIGDDSSCDEDDPMQISLFGEVASVREIENLAANEK